MSMSLRVVSSLSFLLVIISCGGGSSSTPTSPQTGTVSGAVTSGGTGISGASVTVTPSGQSALASVTTSGTGTYSVSSVPVGSGTVTVANLPSGCATPAASNYSGLASNGTVTINVAVTCTAQLGTVSGTVTNSSTSAGISGATVVVTPTGGAALASVTTSSSGAYSVHNVPLGGGAVAVSNLPTGCTTPTAGSYSGLTAGGTATVNIAVTCSGSGGGQAVLFAISKDNTVFGFTAAQLTGTGSVTPAVSFLTGNAGSGYGITFDPSGNMWLGAGVTCSPCSGSVTYTGHVYEYTPSQIASANGSAITPNVDISVLSGAAVGVYDVKFDGQGTLWVTASSYDSLRGYSASQLTASGSPTPAHVLRPQSVAITNGLAFDASGLLWVGSSSNIDETEGSGKLAVGVPVTGSASEDSIVTDGHGGGLLAFIAFDKNGNMWISGGQDSIVAFTKSQIPSGSDASPAEPNIVITLPTGIAQPQGMAFDNDGNLWVICAELSASANSELLRIPAAQLAASGKAVPDVGLIISTDAENNFFGTPRGLAFAPGGGLPLNTSRVVHSTRSVGRRR
jgi:hypothetical protein